jgi:hypothetical protein
MFSLTLDAQREALVVDLQVVEVPNSIPFLAAPMSVVHIAHHRSVMAIGNSDIDTNALKHRLHSVPSALPIQA